MNCNVTANDVYLQMSICMSSFAWGEKGGEPVSWRKNKEMGKINGTLFDPLAQSQVLTAEPWIEVLYAVTKGSIFKGHL